MKIALLSDIHQHMPYVSDVDIAVFAGDFVDTPNGNIIAEQALWTNQYERYFREIRERGIYTIGCPGNHDFLPESSKANFNYVKNQFDTFLTRGLRDIKGFRFYVYCYNKIEGWAYFRNELQQAKDLDSKKIGDLDFIITHTPPYDIMSGRPEWGSQAIRRFTERCKPKHFHMFGHVHSRYGDRYVDDIRYANVAYSTPDYSPRMQYVTYDTDSKLFDIVKTKELSWKS